MFITMSIYHEIQCTDSSIILVGNVVTIDIQKIYFDLVFYLILATELSK